MPGGRDVCSKVKSPSPSTHAPNAIRQLLVSDIERRGVCTGCSSVASDSYPHHEVCDVSEVTFRNRSGRYDTFPVRTLDQPDCMDRFPIYCIDNFPDKSQLPIAGFATRTSTDTFSYTCTTTNNNA